MANSTIEIVSITTGRGSYLIGPAVAFGSNTRDLVFRDRPRIQAILVQLVAQPGAVGQLRLHMRRWGLSHSHSMLNEPEWMREALLKAVSSGQLLISVAPDVTRGFSVPHAMIVRKTTSAAKAQALLAQPHLPVDLDYRLIIVMQMVPDYMSGATKAAFLRTLKDVGVGMIVGGLLAWIGAHFIPGINIAMLAFDLFFLGSDVIKACETIGTQIDAVRKAKSREDLKPAAQAIAGAIAVMLVKGVFNRLLRAKSAPKAASNKTTHAIDEKPNMGKRAEPKREARKPSQTEDVAVALPPTTPRKTLAIGRLDDLKPEKLRPNETTLLLQMKTDLGSPRANWKRNSTLLRRKMRLNQPIRDASADKPDSFRIPTDLNPNRTVRQSFTGMERNVLRNKGWTFDGEYWNPPK